MDAQFYADWWNATNVEQYWKKWNLPVHHWLPVKSPQHTLQHIESDAFHSVL